MALIVQLVNKSNLADVSNYEWSAYIYSPHGCVPLGAGYVTGHRRSDGWKALLKRLVQTLEVEGWPVAGESVRAEASATRTLTGPARIAAGTTGRTTRRAGATSRSSARRKGR